MIAAALAITTVVVAGVTERVSASIPVGVPQLVFEGGPSEVRNFVVTRAGDERTVVEESGWGYQPQWTPNSGLLEPGAAYEALILVGLEQLPPQHMLPEITSELGTGSLAGKDPMVSEWEVHHGPQSFVAPSAQLANLQNGELNGLRMHLFPSFSPTGVNEDFDDRGFTPEPDTFIMQDPWYDVSSTEDVGGYSWMHVGRMPDFNRRVFEGWGHDYEWADITVSSAFNFYDALEWLGGYVLNATIYAACGVARGFMAFFRPSKPSIAQKTYDNCMKGSTLEKDPRFRVTVEAGVIDGAEHALLNTSGAVLSAVETFVGSEQMNDLDEGTVEKGLELDLTESNVGLFPFTTGYVAKGLGYLEIDPDDVVVDADGLVEMTFGVDGPAGAQAWLDGVDRTESLPGYRAQLGPDDALSVSYSDEALVGWWTFNLDGFDDPKPEKFRARFEAAQEAMADDINEVLGDLITDIVESQPVPGVRVGEPIRLEPGVRYPLTLVGWSGFVPGTLGLYMVDEDEGASPVPMSWITPAAEGTRGFNDPVYPDNEWAPSSDTYSMMLSADGSRLAELTEDGLVTSAAHWDGTWLPAEPFKFDRPLTTVTSDELGSTNDTVLLSLDNRVAVNGDGTVVAASFDQIEPFSPVVEESTVSFEAWPDRPSEHGPVDAGFGELLVDVGGSLLGDELTLQRSFQARTQFDFDRSSLDGSPMEGASGDFERVDDEFRLRSDHLSLEKTWSHGDVSFLLFEELTLQVHDDNTVTATSLVGDGIWFLTWEFPYLPVDRVEGVYDEVRGEMMLDVFLDSSEHPSADLRDDDVPVASFVVLVGRDVGAVDQTVTVTELDFDIDDDGTIVNATVSGTSTAQFTESGAVVAHEIDAVSGRLAGGEIELTLNSGLPGEADVVLRPDNPGPSSDLAGEVVIAETTSPWLPLDGSTATVTYLSDLLEQAEADSFRVQDGTLFARTLAIDEAGENLAVSEVWVVDPDAQSVDSTAHSRLLIFDKVDGEWQLSADLERNSATTLDGQLQAVVQDGGYAWIATGSPSVIHQVDVTTMQTIATVDTGIEVSAAAVNADHLIALGVDGTVVLIDVDSMQIDSTLWFEELVHPTQAIALNEDLFIANGGDPERPAHVGVHLDLAQQAVVSTYGARGVHTVSVGANGREPIGSTVTQWDRQVWFTTPASSTIIRIDLDDLSARNFSMSGTGVNDGGVAGISFTRRPQEWCPTSTQCRPHAWLFPLTPDSVRLDGSGLERDVYQSALAFEFDPMTGAYVMQDGVVYSRDVTLFDAPLVSAESVWSDTSSDAIYALEWVDGVPNVVVSFDDGLHEHVFDYQLDKVEHDPGDHGGIGQTALRYPLETLPERQWSSAEMWVVQGYALVAASDGVETFLVSVTPTALAMRDNQIKQLGTNVDVFAGSVDIARDLDGTVRVAVTTPYGVAVYRNEGGVLVGETAVYHSSRRVVTHTNAIALSDDGRTLFTSDPNYTDADAREIAGALRVYRYNNDRWDITAELGAPFDSNGSSGQAFGGKVVANGRFLMVSGITNPIEYTPLWMFRDTWGDWSDFRAWNHIAPPIGKPPPPGSGSFVPTVGGYQWFSPTALIGHRPYDLDHSSLLYRQTASLPFDMIREYRQFPIADGGD
ncbi:MAG: hypothetical protein AAGF73_11845 [Actinomycetota bacterium]